MESNNDQYQNEAVIPSVIQKVQPKKEGAKPNLARIVVTLSLLLLAISGGIYLFRKFGPKPKIKDTGVVITPVTYSPTDPYVELNKLLAMGDFTQDSFYIKDVSRSTEVAVFLAKPYDQSQANFEAWLKANGFGNVPSDQIIFFHQP